MKFKITSLVALLCIVYLIIVYQLVNLAYSIAPFLQQIQPNIFVGACISISVVIISLLNYYFVKARPFFLGLFLAVSGACYMLWPDPSRAFNHIMPIINLILFSVLPIMVCTLFKKMKYNN